jgi:hypothetical protein
MGGFLPITFSAKERQGLRLDTEEKEKMFRGNYIDKLPKSCYLNECCHNKMNGF